MNYIVNVSGGLSSFEALRRTLEKHGDEPITAVFADTMIEDPDLYRFLDDTERHLGIIIVRLQDGRTPFQVWHDERAITVRGGAPCSKLLKRRMIVNWIRANFTNTPYTLVFGMDWSEPHRIQRTTAAFAPIPCWFPLNEPPYVDKCHISDYLEQVGIATPALYRDGFVHNNCGGGCVKTGQAHWAHLYHTRPETYARWEAEEAKLIEHVGKKRTILKDERGGKTVPVTLAEFRARLERGEIYDKNSWGGCGCFTPMRQERFDDLLQATEIKK